jgi:quercetin dioxygenase-like cupin family protein
MSTLVTTGPDEGQSISVGGNTYRILITGEQSGGAYTAIEMLVPPGGGPLPHAHPVWQESFFVMEGEIEVKSAEQGTYTARQGSFVNIPLGGMVHCFKNRTEHLARLLCTVVPAGMDDFFLEFGIPVANGEFLPPRQMTPELAAKMKGIAEKYGQQLFPPDYLD